MNVIILWWILSLSRRLDLPRLPQVGILHPIEWSCLATIMPLICFGLGIQGGKLSWPRSIIRSWIWICTWRHWVWRRWWSQVSWGLWGRARARTAKNYKHSFPKWWQKQHTNQMQQGGISYSTKNISYKKSKSKMQMKLSIIISF